MGTAVNQYLAQLQDALAGKPDRVPAGHLTVAQWSEELGVSMTTTGRLLRSGLKMHPPLVRRVTYKVPSGRGLYPVPHYYWLGKQPKTS